MIVRGEPKPRGLVVMYHYVRRDHSAIPAGIRAFLTSEFEQQLDWLSERYDVLAPDEFLRRIAGASTRDKPPCLLTFDDGTKDHAEVVTPILARRGFSGVFFVLTWPAELGRMPLTHAVHWLLGGDEEKLWQLFERYAREQLGGPVALGDEGEARRIYHYESPLRARIKYAANMALPNRATEAIVHAALAEAGRRESDLAREWFVSAADIRAMHAAAMIIASHGCSHRSLQALGADGIEREMRHSAEYLRQLTGQSPRWFACPFGGSGAADAARGAMRDAFRRLGVVASVTTVKQYVDPGCDPLALPRLDAIDLPPRRSEPWMG